MSEAEYRARDALHGHFLEGDAEDARKAVEQHMENGDLATAQVYALLSISIELADIRHAIGVSVVTSHAEAHMI